MNSALSPEQVQVLARLRRAWPDRQVVLIGAAALGAHLPMTWRRTADLDLTVVADSASVAVDLQHLGLERHPKVEHRWQVPGTNVRLDILPASHAELASGRLVFADSGHVMNLAAFDLAFRHTREIRLEPDVSIAVATLPVIVVLKMVAWLDRPTERDRDLEDLGYVLSDYLPVDDTRRWEDPRLSEVPDFGDQPALALGIDIAEIAEPSHRALIDAFLRAVDLPDSAPFERLARASISGHPEPREALRGRLNAFRKGLSTQKR